jgi:hypothetical protein
MSSLFNRIPLRQHYKDVDEHSLVLRGPPAIARACFVFEMMVAAGAFTAAFYISYTSTITLTTISYEVLGSSYDCSVLSPRSDTKYFSTVSSELAQFSRTQYSYEECVSALGTDEFDVCADENREDYILSVMGVAAVDDMCVDMIIDNNYRFCYGSEANEFLRTDLDATFPRQEDNAPRLTYSNVFYMTNNSAELHTITAPFARGDQENNFLSYDGDVYVVAQSNVNRKYYLYRFSIQASAASELVEIALGSNTLYGLAAKNGVVYMLMVSNGKVIIKSYTIADASSTTFEIPCDSATDNLESHQYIAVGDDDMLYVMYNSAIPAAYNQGVATNSTYDFFRVDPVTQAVEVLKADLGSLDVVTNSTNQDDATPTLALDAVTGLVVVDSYAYFTSGAPNYNLLRVDLTNQPTLMPTVAPTPAPVPPQSPAPTPPMPPPPPRLSNPDGPTARKLTEEETAAATATATATTNLNAATETAAQLEKLELLADATRGAAKAILESVFTNALSFALKLQAGGDEGDAITNQMLSNTAAAIVQRAEEDAQEAVASTIAALASRTRDGTTPLPPSSSSEEHQQHQQQQQNWYSSVRAHTGSSTKQTMAGSGDVAVVQPSENLGEYKGINIISAGNNIIYFANGNKYYYNITSDTFDTLGEFRENYFYATAIQLAFSYGICNEVIVNYTINTGSTSDFFDQCQDSNGYVV